MYKRWKRNKGITLVSLVILVIVLMIVSAVMIINVSDKYNSQKLDKLASDLQQLTEKTSIYYVENKEYPTTGEAEEIVISSINSGNPISVKQIDLTKLHGLTLNYGNNASIYDYYVIDILNGTVYYKKGIDGIYNLVQAEKIDGIDVLKITKQPQWQSIEARETGTLSVEVNAKEDTDIKYQWYVTDTYDGEGNEITGADTNTLSIQNLSSSNEKYYYCKIIYKGVTQKTDVVKLQVEKVRAGEYTGNRNKEYIDTEGNIAVIPAGFTVSNIENEKTISGGLVVYSGNYAGKDLASVQSIANQYVWIPMDDINDIVGTLDSTLESIAGQKYGKLYFKTLIDKDSRHPWPGDADYLSTSYREPAVLSEYDTEEQYYKDILGYNNLDAYKEGMKTEFSNMIASVEKYDGSYIGRYELTGSATTPTVQKSQNPLTGMNWYNFYNVCTRIELDNEDAKNKVRTSMIWGSQWDQAVKKCLSFDNNFLTSNANLYGYYKDSKDFEYTTINGTTGTKVEGTTVGVIKSGCTKPAYNIYDMGGNVWDWTLESSNTNYRIKRGGTYGYNASEYTASGRSNNDPLYTLNFYGCRSQLYIEP